MNHAQEQRLLTKYVSTEWMEYIKKHNAFIAGGAIRSLFTQEPVNDIDVFFHNQKDFDAFVKSLRQCKDGSPTFSVTDTAWTHIANKQSYQLICASYGTPQEVIAKFDFTCCMASWHPTQGFLLAENFLKHSSQRRLVFNTNAEYPLCSLWRALKFVKRGWKLSGVEVIKLSLAIHHLQLKDRKELKRQLLGIDTLFLKELVEALTKEDANAAYEFSEAIDVIANFVDEE